MLYPTIGWPREPQNEVPSAAVAPHFEQNIAPSSLFRRRLLGLQFLLKNRFGAQDVRLITPGINKRVLGRLLRHDAALVQHRIKRSMRRQENIARERFQDAERFLVVVL